MPLPLNWKASLCLKDPSVQHPLKSVKTGGGNRPLAIQVLDSGLFRLLHYISRALCPS